MAAEVKGFTYEAIDIWFDGAMTGDHLVSITTPAGTVDTVVNLENPPVVISYPTRIRSGATCPIYGENFGTEERSLKAIRVNDVGEEIDSSFLDVVSWTNTYIGFQLLPIWAIDVPTHYLIQVVTDHGVATTSGPIEMLRPIINTVTTSFRKGDTITLTGAMFSDTSESPLFTSFIFDIMGNNTGTEFDILSYTTTSIELRFPIDSQLFLGASSVTGTIKAKGQDDPGNPLSIFYISAPEGTTLTPDPTITRVLPEIEFYVKPDDIITIEGSSFGTTAHQVTIGSRVYSGPEITSWSNSQIKVKISDEDHGTEGYSGSYPGCYAITVTTIDLVDTPASDLANIRIYHVPELISCTPDNMRYEEPTEVTLMARYAGRYGNLQIWVKNHDGSMQRVFLASNITPSNDESAILFTITATIKIIDFGTSYIWLECDAGKTNEIMLTETANQIPEITKPTAVEMNSYTTQIIYGNNFGTNPGALYIGLDIVDTLEWDDEYIKFDVPAMSNDPETIKVQHSNTNYSNEWEVNFNAAPPEILSPTVDKMENDIRIELFGKNFTRKGTVYLKETTEGVHVNERLWKTFNETEVVWWQNDSIVFNLPNSNPGTFDITVKTLAGESAAWDIDIQFDKPCITSISPPRPDMPTENDVMTISGIQFGDGSGGMLKFNSGVYYPPVKTEFTDNTTELRSGFLHSWNDTSIVIRTPDFFVGEVLSDAVDHSAPGHVHTVDCYTDEISMQVINADGYASDVKWITVNKTDPEITGDSNATAEENEEYIVMGTSFFHDLVIQENVQTTVHPGRVTYAGATVPVIKWDPSYIIFRIPAMTVEERDAGSVSKSVVVHNHYGSSTKTIEVSPYQPGPPQIAKLVGTNSSTSEVVKGGVLTILGSKFTAVKGSVYINGVSVTEITEWATGHINIIIPETATTPGVITVETPVGLSNSMSIAIIESTPYITRLTPTDGPAGSARTITGRRFLSGGEIIMQRIASPFDYVAFDQGLVSSWSDTRVVYRAPAAKGVFRLKVKNSADETSTNYAEIQINGTAPRITGITPQVADIGTAITIQGTDLTGLRYSKLYIGSIVTGKSSASSNWTDSAISALAPPRAGTYYVKVVTESGESNTFPLTAVLPHTYPPPANPTTNIVLETVTPESVAMQDVITLRGEGFGTQYNTCKVCVGTEYAEILTWSATKITAKMNMPNTLAVGIYKVFVKTNDGESNRKQIYVKGITGAAPTITSVTPETMSPYSPIKIVGTGFKNITLLAQQFDDGITFSLRKPVGCNVYLKDIDNNKIQLRVNSWDDTTIYAAAKGSTDIEFKQYSVEIENPNGTVTSTTKLQPQKPQIQKLSTVRAAKDQRLILYGRNFGFAKTGSVVIDDGINSQFAEIVDWEDTNIICRVPEFESAESNGKASANVMVVSSFGPSNSVSMELVAAS